MSEWTHVERDREGHFTSDIRDQEHRARRRARWNWYTQRFSDLSKVIALRIAPENTIPQTDDAEILIRCMAYHLQAKCGEDEVWQELDDWCRSMAPWVQKGAADVLAPILRAISGRRRDLTAKTLGKELQVSWAERCELGLRTIRPFGLSETDFIRLRDDRKRQIDRENAEAKRRESGQKTWAEHAWQHAEEPWKLVGVSKRSWHRYKSNHRLTSLVSQSAAEVPSWLAEFAKSWDDTAPAGGTVSSRIAEGIRACDEKVPTSSHGIRGRGDQTIETGRPTQSLRSHSAGSASVSPASATAKMEGVALDGTLRPLRNFEQVLPAKGVRHARRSAA